MTDPGFSGGGSDEFPPTLSDCYCCLTSPFFIKKVWSKYLCLFHSRGSTEPPEPPLEPPQDQSLHRHHASCTAGFKKLACSFLSFGARYSPGQLVVFGFRSY